MRKARDQSGKIGSVGVIRTSVPGRAQLYRRWRRIELAWLVAAFAATLMMTYVLATVVSTDNGIRTEAGQR